MSPKAIAHQLHREEADAARTERASNGNTIAARYTRRNGKVRQTSRQYADRTSHSTKPLYYGANQKAPPMKSQNMTAMPGPIDQESGCRPASSRGASHHALPQQAGSAPNISSPASFDAGECGGTYIDRQRDRWACFATPRIGHLS